MNSKKWIKKFFITILFFGLCPYVFSFYFLKSNFENNNYQDLINRQLKNNSIYGTSLNQNTFLYKLELIKSLKPEIIALGSSRVMQFRQEFFNNSFVNAGGAMNHLNEGYMFLEEMYKYHRPKYIILGLDFWWFNDDYREPNNYPYHLNTGDIMTFSKFIKPYYYLLTNKIETNTLKNLILPTVINNQYTNYDNLGFAAIKTSDGFRSDGSYFYSKLIFGIEKSTDIKFQNTLNRIKNGNNRFEYGSHISKNRIEELNKIINFISKNDSKLILIIPPVANTIFKNLTPINYDYINKFRNYVQNLKVMNYDYHDISRIAKNDCEFIDGFHGGDIIYQRILLDLYSKNQLNTLINYDRISENIIYFKGNTLSKIIKSNYKFEEVDFLDLGCNKFNLEMDKNGKM